jgi:hypothetical protein
LLKNSEDSDDVVPMPLPSVVNLMVLMVALLANIRFGRHSQISFGFE